MFQASRFGRVSKRSDYPVSSGCIFVCVEFKAYVCSRKEFVSVPIVMCCLGTVSF